MVECLPDKHKTLRSNPAKNGRKGTGIISEQSLLCSREFSEMAPQSIMTWANESSKGINYLVSPHVQIDFSLVLVLTL
jgi:hypothetical protein